MRNYLNPSLDDDSIHKISNLGLAHVGDSVFEVMVRSMLASDGVLTSRTLHKETINLVNANAQAAGSKFIVDILTEEERAYFNRGRNSKPKTVPKSSSREQYGLSTALETLFGYLYLKQKYDRINQLFDIIMVNLRNV